MAKKRTDKAERILEAAARVLAREGYGGATVAVVAAEAGVSRGLLHYYFENKEDMVARVLRRNVGRTTALLRSIAASAATPAVFASALTGALRRVAEDEPALFTVLAEALSASRRSVLIGRELTELHGHFTAAFEEAFRAWADQGHMPRRPSFRGLAVVLTALVDGLGLDLVAVKGLAREDDVWRTFEQALVHILTGGTERGS
ncbi:MAG: TetR/AcrR family transcriptional regulator [Gemmatimonadota bacterium]